MAKTYKKQTVAKKIVFASIAVFFVLMAFLWPKKGFDDWVHQLASISQEGTQVYFQEDYYIGNVYGARVTAFSHGSQICFGNKYAIHGSSLPDPGDYPVILAGSYYFQRGQHFGTLANIFFNSKLSPALILNAGAELNGKGRGGAVPTINVNRSPLAGDNFGLHQATEIHVHTGLSQTLRGSSGCLTIEPDEAKAFFDSKISFYGTIHIMRPVQKS